MKVSNTKTKANPCELHLCLRHLFLICRWIGFFPVEGLNRTNCDRIRFNLKSIYIIYFLLSSFSQLIKTFLTFYWFVTHYISLNNISVFIYNLIGLLSIIFLLKLARYWPTLVKMAADTESSLEDIRVSKNTAVKTRAISYVILSLAFVEHMLSMLYNLKMVTSCTIEDDYNVLLESYFKFKMAYVFKYVDYHIIYGILGEFFVFQITFLWSFTDVLIMCLSIYLSSYFQDLNTSIYSYKNKYLIPWSKMRLHYSRLVILLKKIDSHLCRFILTSVFCNLFFICLQLFNALQRNYPEYDLCDLTAIKRALDSPDYLLYYIFSCVFLVTRAFLLCLFAANVHSTARGPLLAVYDVPPSCYCMEVQRFQQQLRYTTIGLSGMCFYVTRKMILKVIGTIVTYELVLLQFNKRQAISIAMDKKNNITVFNSTEY
ncbi:hypothetical protein K1T71_003486 [Dendrolimus kikuchii]|uniref:Uncharacterized protein n=1 Tax=Dendrolimus kikuchii TaxID=765133 RepID=A0ACC1DC80_9NEOP|nr:hypothetical protein K1T71_003486 [Dendrolimus kikuchii]